MLSQRQAALEWRLGRETLTKAIKAGKLSLMPDKRIDPAEMLRVFGEPRPVPDPDTRPPKAIQDPSGLEAKIAGLETEIDRLRKIEIDHAGLAATVAAQHANLADLRAQVLRLTHEQPPILPSRRHWWQRG